jgi:zinc transport system ATP-binding protein
MNHHCVPLLTLKEVTVRLGANQILRGLSADFARGEVTALIGLNGAGKTTLLRVLLQEVPYSGQVQFHCGHDHTGHQPQHIGYVPQRLLFDPNLPLTVEELLTLALTRRPLWLGISRAVRQRSRQLLERVQAGHLLRHSVGSLSGGELQRVLLALALEPAPELLLLDEPAAGIDFKHESEFYGLITRLNRDTGVTVILVSHDLSVVSQAAHHVLCLNEGHIQCAGTPQEVLTGEMVDRVFGANKGVYQHQDHHHPTDPVQVKNPGV